MAAIGTPMGLVLLDRYLVMGEGSADRIWPAFYGSSEDIANAQYTAMAWFLTGFSTRVIDLQVDPLNSMAPPTMPFVYNTLQPVTNLAAAHGVKITTCSYQVQPPVVPWPITEPDFYAWLQKQSLLPPTWPPVASAMVTHLQMGPPPTVGVVHVQGLSGGTICGAKGHSEKDRPFDVPLRRSLAATYCEDCVRSLAAVHQEFVRAWSRSQMYHVRGALVEPAHQEAYRLYQEAQEQSRPKPVWAEPVTVTVNGRDQVVEGTLLDYAEVAALAPDQVEPAITFREKDGRHGTLVPGESLVVRAGTVFNIYNTGSA